jgi:hypothetical protein
MPEPSSLDPAGYDTGDFVDPEDLPVDGEHAYQAGLIEEARAIVAGQPITPSIAHLWACLSWLDGAAPPLPAATRP